VKKLLNNDEIADMIEKHSGVSSMPTFDSAEEAAERGYISSVYLREQHGYKHCKSSRMIDNMAKSMQTDVIKLMIGSKICKAVKAP